MINATITSYSGITTKTKEQNMTTREATLAKMVTWMQTKNMPMDTLREVARDVRATPPAGAGDDETASLVAMAVRRVVRMRVDAELATKSDDELRTVAAQLTNAQGNYVDQLVGPAESDALAELAKARHPEAAAAVEAWEFAGEGMDRAPAMRRFDRLGAFDYYATAADLN